jgi:hypothetical protein
MNNAAFPLFITGLEKVQAYFLTDDEGALDNLNYIYCLKCNDDCGILYFEPRFLFFLEYKSHNGLLLLSQDLSVIRTK